MIKTTKRRVNHRHMVLIALSQGLVANVCLMLLALFWYFLAAYPVYRVVSIVIIVILWSNVASMVARRKPLSMRETVLLPAVKRHLALPEETQAYLKAIKISFLRNMHESR